MAQDMNYQQLSKIYGTQKHEACQQSNLLDANKATKFRS